MLNLFAILIGLAIILFTGAALLVVIWRTAVRADG